MRNMSFDWRWIAVIGIVILLLNVGQNPLLAILFLGGGGAYVLYMGWQAWTRAGGSTSSTRVTYWRGQRIELKPERSKSSLPKLSNIGPAALYLLIGGVMVLAAISMAINRFS
ncbi:MAG: hypothetical protein GFH27_549281n438 [Chloroflexi bacterium AL-W]|nr:hypothetical protein [Chloroflexi bacterium AL-N1]NOK70931.1 hypothetical protein [Chloroflexi bacterium AL-N10]NOK73204.1 hypothetical protein [Chloroflexi bacterium AL-N5]NOK80101.1 hypothetical protein [Chloroflexi bacterium AL-W]NOK88044.1 hypothetical protein [Chloroflexi bacterium AL-N15]